MDRGTTLAGRYIIRELFRQDVCGTTYLAQDTGSDLLVALQIIPDQVAKDARFLADFRRNFLLLHTLDHPNITKMHALEQDAELRIHFLVQEYTAGVSLLDYRLSRPGQTLLMAEAVEICRQIADALDHAHRSLLHRNLRPDNIIITPEGDVKLWNFGLIPDALQRELRLAVGWAYGQPEARAQCYMAPEQLAGLPSHSPASDRWALAVVFYELISGHLPFDFPEEQALVHAICTLTPELPDGLGRHHRWLGADQVFARAFAKDPGERFPTASVFIQTVDFHPFPRSLREFRKMALTTSGIIVLALFSWGLGVIFPSFSPEPSDHRPRPAHVDTRNEHAALTPDLKKSLLLQVESRPEGASVVLDGKPLGTTPFTVGRVAPGAYHLWLEKPGFTPVEVEIDLTQDTIVSMSLDPLSSATPQPVEEKPAQPTATFPLSGMKTILLGPDPDALVPVSASPSVQEDAGSAAGAARKPQTGKTAPASETAPIAERKKPLSAQEAQQAQQAQQVREQIRVLLRGAARDMKASRLTRPAGKNALEKYRAVQKMDPHNPTAREGIRHIVDRLMYLVKKNIDAGYLTKPPGRNASERLRLILLLDPRHPEIGQHVADLVARYVSLTTPTGHTPKLLRTLLDQAVTTLPGEPIIAAARQALLPLKSETTEETSATTVSHTSAPFATVRPETPSGSPSKQASPAPAGMIKFTEVSTISQPGKQPFRTWLDPITGLAFVWINPGCFDRGSTQGDNDEEPVHKVCLDGFWLGRHEVTQQAWQRTLGDEANPSKFQKGGTYPVDSVSWETVQRFIQRLNARSPDRFRLPTEAEWEYACRAGQQTPFHFGNAIHAGKANFNGERTFEEGRKGHYVGHTLPVGSFSPNHFGLFDMHGNVYEWVEDRYKKDYYGRSPRSNPSPPALPDAVSETENLRVLRGGAWYSNPRNLRCAYRYRGPATQRNHGYGFRIVRVHAP